MKVYLAGVKLVPYIEDKYYNFYRLNSFEYLKKDDVECRLINYFKDYILDSGAFSYINGKDSSDVDWDRYVFEYANFIKKYNIEKYVEVDVDVLIGLNNVEKLRKDLEKKVGWKSIPVWHMNRGYDKWLQICKDYSYISFGSFISDKLPRSKYNGVKKFLIDASKNNCKVHGLGFTNMKWIRELKFYSVDSSSWTGGNRFGFLYKFEDGRNPIIKQVEKPKNTRIFDHGSLARHNFYEWIKFCRYAEKNL